MERWTGKMFGLYATGQFPSEPPLALFSEYEMAQDCLEWMTDENRVGCDYVILETELDGRFKNGVHETP